MTYRVLVTGSRGWHDETAVHHALQTLRGKHGPLTIVHGACPSGADYMAQTFAVGKPDVTVERHPADWKRRGPKAGPERNAHMVQLGADACLAFIGPCTSPRCSRPGRHDSHGATGCADLAEAHGIPVTRHYADDRPRPRRPAFTTL
jgi:hypothetical protein